MKVIISGDTCEGFILRNQIVKFLRGRGKSSTTETDGDKYIITVVDEE